jgi:hypothetical protein
VIIADRGYDKALDHADPSEAMMGDVGVHRIEEVLVP